MAAAVPEIANVSVREDSEFGLPVFVTCAVSSNWTVSKTSKILLGTGAVFFDKSSEDGALFESDVVVS